MKKKPNVIIIITDDQGFPDLGCSGNSWIKTPNIDLFYEQSIRMTDFHVHPVCTPTRGAIMSGNRPIKNGAWATTWGRSILRKNERTIADIFGENGYATGLFGKWHLGDNYPYRPFDRGFQHVVAHKGGGVGQTPDFWGNNYFDDTYFHNGLARQHEGYCTDVWFEEAAKFIEKNRERPFFALIATNAPHSPYLVDEKYAAQYRENPEIVSPEFYGMISNIDENFGELERKLEEWGIKDDTILIFLTDNGSSGSCTTDGDDFPIKGYNAGLRGKKGSYYDGGHKVPFIIRWPNGNIQGGVDIYEMCLDIDMLPTLINLCELDNEAQFDGESFAAIFNDPSINMPDRYHFIQFQQSTTPPDKDNNCTMTRDWRLVSGKELYNIKEDPGQKNDVSSKFPDVFGRMKAAHLEWWEGMKPYFTDICAISLGNEAENPTTLCAFDVMGDVAWNQGQIISALKSSGNWNVDIEQSGKYRFALRRWPEELAIPIENNVSRQFAKTAILPNQTLRNIVPETATLVLFDQTYEQTVEPGSEESEFILDVIQTGKTMLQCNFTDNHNEIYGAYYVVIEKL